MANLYSDLMANNTKDLSCYSYKKDLINYKKVNKLK
jgi:hypothetical protein